MLTSQAVAKELPRLRRYARALTGNQESGDAYVVTTLEALAEDPSSLTGEDGILVTLFRTFTKIWNSVELNAVPTATTPDQYVVALTPLPRQAFLLVALEDFPEAVAARILDVSVAELSRLIEESGRELATEIATDVMIIEDEPLIAMDLESLVESLGHGVTGIARTQREAVALAAKKQPGLILADIRLADMTSRRRPASIAFPRQVAMFLSRSLTKGSLMEIGEAFGGRDHGTVIHACKKITDQIDKEPGLKETIARIESQLRR